MSLDPSDQSFDFAGSEKNGYRRDSVVRVVRRIDIKR